ncbi:PadR family transcriptional regulator [Methanocella sp. MCL-LM]|uniref:PadR family transcriptional regulator n=1 Tax=Methanocella sp. MCL-LM TaxID=3412035 RepID=UPI003C78F188
MDEVVERFETEVRRGMIQVTIMCLLEQEYYGYDIIRNLKEVGIDIDDGTLYPILRRLEDDRLLVSRWETTGPRPRKYYVITEYGKEIREQMLASLASMNAAVETFKAHIMGAHSVGARSKGVK